MSIFEINLKKSKDLYFSNFIMRMYHVFINTFEMNRFYILYKIIGDNFLTINLILLLNLIFRWEFYIYRVGNSIYIYIYMCVCVCI